MGATVPGANFYADGYTGRARIVVDVEHGYLLGASFVGPGVAELLHSATIAVAARVPIDRLWHAVPCFPTISEVWLRLMEANRDAPEARARSDAITHRNPVTAAALGMIGRKRSTHAW